MNIQSVCLFDLTKTISRNLISSKNYPWEIIDEIKKYILKLGDELPQEKFEKINENIWVAKTARISKTAEINGPCIIDENTEIRQCAFIRGGVIIGKECVIGNSTELKNCILFDNVQVPHFNYIGDSILGYKVHFGAGVITSNVKCDRSLVEIKKDKINFKTGLKKLGVIIGDYVEVGCNSVLCPGTIIGRKTNIYPLSMIRGVIEENKIYKGKNQIIDKF